MKKSQAGAWEHDFRLNGVPRFHASYGRVKKADAERLHAVAVALFRSRDLTVIEALRSRVITLEQLAQLRERQLPFAAALPAAGERVTPWPTLGDAVTMYVAGIRKNPKRAEGTARAAETQLARALPYLGAEVRLDDITTQRVTDYQAFLQGERMARNTITAYVWRVGALYRWFLRREVIDARDEKRAARVLHVPINVEEISTEQTRRSRWLTEAEAARLIAATPAPMQFAIACGLYAGLRVDEMIHLRPAFDVDLSRGVLTVQARPGWRPKSKRSARIVPISDALRPVLEAHLARWSSPSWVTPSFREGGLPLNRHTFDTHFGQIITAAGLLPGRTDPEGVTYHTLRHTFASWLIMRGVDLYTTAQLLGNMVKQVEDTYGHLSQDHRASAVNKLVGAVPGSEFSPASSTKGAD